MENENNKTDVPSFTAYTSFVEELSPKETAYIKSRAEKMAYKGSIDQKIAIQEHILRTKKSIKEMDKNKLDELFGGLTELMNDYYANEHRNIVVALHKLRQAMEFLGGPFKEDGEKILYFFEKYYVAPSAEYYRDKKGRKSAALNSSFQHAFSIADDMQTVLSNPVDKFLCIDDAMRKLEDVYKNIHDNAPMPKELFVGIKAALGVQYNNATITTAEEQAEEQVAKQMNKQ